MSETNEQQRTDGDPNVDPEDLDLVDDSLEDEGKDDAALWQEFDTAESGAAAPASDDTTPPPGETGGEGDDGEPGAAAGEAEGSDSAAGGAGEGEPSPGQQPDGGEPSGTQDKVWADATPEQRAAHEAAQAQIAKLEQAERSNRGRLSALQRQLNDLQRKPPAAPSSEDGKGAAGGEEGDPGEQADSDFLASKDWEAFKEEYPEVAGPMEKVVGTLQSHIKRQEKELSAIGQERRQSALEEQASVLIETHPDWQEVTAEEGFVEWLDSQPRHIREAAMRNAEDIVDAEEAADVVGRFKEYRAAQTGGDDARNKGSRDTSRGNRNDALTGRRQRQLESASTARTRTPGGPSGIPEDGDEEKIWKQFDDMERRQAS